MRQRLYLPFVIESFHLDVEIKDLSLELSLTFVDVSDHPLNFFRRLQ
jgi:hypothetical protein